MRGVVDPWFKARDFFLGENGEYPDLEEASLHAAKSSHPDAVWFLHFYRQGLSLDEYCRQNPNDELGAFYFALSDDFDEQHTMTEVCDLVRMVAMYEHPYACSIMNEWWNLDDGQAMSYALTAVNGGERDGYLALANCYDEENARDDRFQLLEIAARMGNLNAMFKFGTLIEMGAPDKFDWMFNGLMEQLQPASMADAFSDEIRDAVVIYMEGMNYEIMKKTIYRIGKLATRFRYAWLFTDPLFARCAKHLEFAKAQFVERNKEVRACIDMWCLVAKRLGVMKDIRRLVAQIVWAEREHMDGLGERVHVKRRNVWGSV